MLWLPPIPTPNACGMRHRSCSGTCHWKSGTVCVREPRAFLSNSAAVRLCVEFPDYVLTHRPNPQFPRVDAHLSLPMCKKHFAGINHLEERLLDQAQARTPYKLVFQILLTTNF